MTKLSGTAKSTYVQKMFDSIAPRYDLMNAVMTFGQHQSMRRSAARIAQPPRNGLALDLATGTGDFAIALQEVEPTCRVVGVDFAVEMMRLGQTKYNGQVQFTAGDMLKLPMPDNIFDCTVNGFVLRNVADVRTAFTEMYRVLKPGGRAVSLEITSPRTPIWKDIFGIYFDHMMPRIGGWLSGNPDAYRYLPQSVHDFLAPEAVVDLMRAVGFHDVYFRRWALGSMAIYVGIK
ncbi:MAG: bifunctional demethylmenaquinone methyltransferase/2-methoxy-6-polyprenyl-1,4-benzoquinol methylase UbiE [Chloroflexi bacterium]|nr:bifunctional demethylmenaquinone methyltransferase/2-methoxy-6-polyprenyl-1,4-benzoquinol methylase UbiE [Chloroflexota bacterium]